MSLAILNNVAALYAQASLNKTQASLQNTLQQLSSGSRINSAADDAAGLAVADGLQANEAALTQSARNVSAGIDLLQTADGALSQVTSLLDRGITLATEALGGTLTAGQFNSANQEYQNILTQIGNIGAHTNFNSIDVFGGGIVNFDVTDGTTKGLNNYADVVGILTAASVGTTGASPIASVVTSAPVVAVPNQAGQYTLTAGSSSDTLAGTISFNIGGGPQQNINVAAGSNLATVSGQLTQAGLTNSVSSNVINITGPITGADAAANAVNFSGTSVSFTPAASSLAAGSAGTEVITPAEAATGSLTLEGDSLYTRNDNSTGDYFSGTIILDQAGQVSKTITIAPSQVDPANDPGSVEYQIVQQLQGSVYGAPADTGNWNDPVFNFTGANTASPVTIDPASTFHNMTTLSATTVAGAGTPGSSEVSRNTYTLAALATSADTFGSSAGNANTLDINGANLSIAGMTATQAQQAIDDNGTLQSAGISASVSADGTTLTIDGNPGGGALSVEGYDVGALALTDQPPSDWLTGSAIGTPGNMGNPGSGTLTFSGANSGDTFGGTFTLSQGPNHVVVSITPGSNLMEMEDQIEQQTMESVFDVMEHGGTPSNPVFSVWGSNTSTPVTFTVGSLTDTSTPSATFTGAGVPGKPATRGTYDLAALSSSSDTFGSGANHANKLDIDGAEISIAGMTAQQAEQAIDGNSTLQSDGITASVNAAGTQVTLLGNANGEGFSVEGYQGTALALSDSEVPSGSITQTVAPLGADGSGGTAVITMSSSTDTLSGPLQVVVNGQIASLVVADKTTGLELQNQINLDPTFQAASLTALYDPTHATITITGPAGAGSSLDTTGTSLTDTTAAGTLAGAGANFTPVGVATLDASTATAILTTFTSAIADVAYQRGTLGAEINQLDSASNVASAESINLTATQDSITATDYGKAASDLSRYQVLSQTGISALAQANTVQQEVLKLLQ